MNDPHESGLSDESAALPENIATAPGDLPSRELQLRAALRARQFRHDNTLDPPAPAPWEPVSVHATSGMDLPLAEAAVFYTTDGCLPDHRSPHVTMNVTETHWEALGGFLRIWSAQLPGQANGTLVRYRIGGRHGAQSGALPDVWAHDGQGFWFHFSGDQGLTTFAYRVEEQPAQIPSWIDAGIIYQIFLDRFHPGTADGAFPHQTGPREIHGGTLCGVIQALPYLDDLGVTTLWLSPIWAAETYHRYDVLDLFQVDPRLGTEQDLRDLVQDAHARGMRVILDFVPSHCSWHHPAFLAAQRDRGAASAGWFTFFSWPDRYRNFLGVVPHLPSWNLEDSGARAHVIAGALHWMRRCGVDGYRLDHAIGPSMDFWVALRAAMRTVQLDCFTVGEVTDSPDCLRRYRGRMDAVLDFPLAGALRSTFGTGTWSLEKLDTFLRAYDHYMASGPCRVSFLDNHDMDRFLWLAGHETGRLKMAALCQFTLTSPPVIYYGTEIGIRQDHGIAESGFGGDAAVRTDMPWHPAAWDRDLHAFYRRLIHLRRRYPALRSGIRTTLICDDRRQLLAYVCGVPQGQTFGDCLLAAFNLNPETQAILPPLSSNQPARCLLSTGDPPSALDTGLYLPPRTAALFLLL